MPHINYELRGASSHPPVNGVYGDVGLNCLISTAENLHQNMGKETYVVGVDYETKQEHLIWHCYTGRVPHQHRFIRIENIVEGV